MTAIPVGILATGRELAQSLRHEGRQDDALVIDTLDRRELLLDWKRARMQLDLEPYLHGP